MTPKLKEQKISPAIVPIDDETYAMLDYAEGAEAKTKLAQAREEIRNGEGIKPTPEYFADLNRRISERTKNVDPHQEA